MIARSAQPFTLRRILDRVGAAPTRQRVSRADGIRLNLWQLMLAALGVGSLASPLAWRSEILLHDQPERFRRFCRDCRQDTAHEGFDEFGAGWYAQICRCRSCGRQGMTVWPLGWW